MMICWIEVNTLKNNYEIRGDITAIFLKRRNAPYLETLIDTEDLEKVMAFPNTWSCNFMKNTGTYYAVGDFRKDGKRGKELLHRIIMDGPSKLLVVDHINHDTLDNRKSNLRIITNAENFQNMSGPYKNNKSGIRGVCWHKASQKWYAFIKVHGKCKYLGLFEDIEEAKKVAVAARKQMMPFFVEEAMENGS